MEAIQKIYNANVYVDGTSSLLGKLKECELPKISAVTEEHEALGMIGKLKLPTGQLELLEAKLTWNTFYADALVRAVNPFDTHKIQIRDSVESHDASGRSAQVPLLTTLGVRWTVADLGKRSKGTATEFAEELSCHYVKQMHGSRVLVEIDVQNNIWIVDGRDLLAEYKKNLGL